MADDVQQLTLEQAATLLLEECRMVLPGVQALLGFQLVAVFSNGFPSLANGEQLLHLFAILCVVLSVALVLAPAALHRLREPRTISSRFLQTSSRLLMWSMAPLAIGTTLDVYIVARVITRSPIAAGAAAAFSLAAFALLWAIFPSRARLASR